jgi:hypothetical protein
MLFICNRRSWLVFSAADTLKTDLIMDQDDDKLIADTHTTA